MFGGVYDVGPQLVGKAGMRKLLIVVGDPEAKVVGALFVERCQKRVGKAARALWLQLSKSPRSSANGS